jgi:SAM-dependent methyltransferase
MVDLGCGTMPYRPLMLGLGISYTGADIVGDADLRIGPDGRVPLHSNSVDAVLSVQVLEHVADLDAYCAEIRRLMRDEGILLLSTHGTWLYHPHPEDHRRWTRTGLVAELEKRGLVTDEIFAVMGPLATTTVIRSSGFAFVARKLPLLGPLIAGCMAVIMNVRAWLEDRITPAGMRNDNACVYLVRARKATA